MFPLNLAGHPELHPVQGVEQLSSLQAKVCNWWDLFLGGCKPGVHSPQGKDGWIRVG